MYWPHQRTLALKYGPSSAWFSAAPSATAFGVNTTVEPPGVVRVVTEWSSSRQAAACSLVTRPLTPGRDSCTADERVVVGCAAAAVVGCSSAPTITQASVATTSRRTE